MYRYSRGQPGQGGSLPRPAWGAGGGRATSPEPGSASGGGGGVGATGGSNEPDKDRLETAASQSEVIRQLENELMELRNACAWKDQRIAELSRTDVPVARLKRDVRLLAAELHHTRKELSESVRELQEYQGQLSHGDGDGNAPSRDVLEGLATGGGAPATPTAGSSAGRGSKDRGSGQDRSAQLSDRIAELAEENRQLKDQCKALQVQQIAAQAQAPASVDAAPVREQSFDSLLHNRQPSGSTTQRVPAQDREQQPMGSMAPPGSAGPSPTNNQMRPPFRGKSHVPQPSSATSMAPVPAHEEPLRQIVYSSARTENIATIGPTVLQGIGTLDGVASVAKVLLSRVQSSICCAAHRRPAMGMAVGMQGQPGQQGQLMGQMVGMPGM